MTASPCRCDAYPEPHKDGVGKCTGEGWCDDCGAATELFHYGGPNLDQYQKCPKCGWNNK